MPIYNPLQRFRDTWIPRRSDPDPNNHNSQYRDGSYDEEFVNAEPGDMQQSGYDFGSNAQNTPRILDDFPPEEPMYYQFGSPSRAPVTMSPQMASQMQGGRPPLNHQSPYNQFGNPSQVLASGSNSTMIQDPRNYYQPEPYTGPQMNMQQPRGQQQSYGQGNSADMSAQDNMNISSGYDEYSQDISFLADAPLHQRFLNNVQRQRQNEHQHANSDLQRPGVTPAGTKSQSQDRKRELIDLTSTSGSESMSESDDEDEGEDEEDDEDSEDDVPLMQLAHHHEMQKSKSPSQHVKSEATDSVLGRGSPAEAEQLHYQTQGQDQEEKENQVQVQSQEQDHDEEMEDEEVEGAEKENETEGIDWKLPEYEAIYITTPEAYPLAKVSLPGLIRHEILLSPDHSTSEFHLLQTVFLPTQRSLHTSHQTPTLLHPTPLRPDEEAKLALLNFHTVSVLVIEAYYNLTKDVPDREFDPDELFFAAIDNWRIGREAGKGNYGAIRGIQEFCDIALDVVFYIKEHGLKGQDEEKKRVRRERSDKGVKRGPRGQGAKAEKEQQKGKGKQTASAKTTAGAGRAKVNKLEAKPKQKLKVNMKAKGGETKAVGKVKAGRVEKKRK